MASRRSRSPSTTPRPPGAYPKSSPAPEEPQASPSPRTSPRKALNASIKKIRRPPRNNFFSPLAARRANFLAGLERLGHRQLVEDFQYGPDPVVAKDIPATSASTSAQMQIIQERCDHAHLVRLIAWEGFDIAGADRRAFYEWCDYGTLQEALERSNGRGLPEDLIWRVLMSVLKALLFLQTGEVYEYGRRIRDPEEDYRPIVHHYINPNTIFFQSRPDQRVEGADEEALDLLPVVKLGNFRKARMLASFAAEAYDATRDIVPFDDWTGFEAPEISWHDGVTPFKTAADIWSLGVVVLAMMGSDVMQRDSDSNFTGEAALNPMASHIISEGYSFWPSERMPHGYTNELKIFLQDLLHVEPAERLSVKTALETAQRQQIKYLLRSGGDLANKMPYYSDPFYENERFEADLQFRNEIRHREIRIQTVKLHKQFWDLHETMKNETDYGHEHERSKKAINVYVDRMLEENLIDVAPDNLWNPADRVTSEVLLKDAYGRLVLDEQNRVMIDPILAYDLSELEGYHDGSQADVDEDENLDDDASAEGLVRSREGSDEDEDDQDEYVMAGGLGGVVDQDQNGGFNQDAFGFDQDEHIRQADELRVQSGRQRLDIDISSGEEDEEEEQGWEEEEQA